MHEEALRSIADLLNGHNIHWALGGSSLLAFYGLAARPNDLDLLVSEAHAARARDLLMPLGEYKELAPKEPFRTKHFYHFEMLGTSVDVMGVLAIRHAEGIYRLHWQQSDVDRTEMWGETAVPLSTLEDWYVLYSLMPGRQEKADLIERYWCTQVLARKDRLEAALREPLPAEVRQRIDAVLANKRRS